MGNVMWERMRRLMTFLVPCGSTCCSFLVFAFVCISVWYFWAKPVLTSRAGTKGKTVTQVFGGNLDSCLEGLASRRQGGMKARSDLLWTAIRVSDGFSYGAFLALLCVARCRKALRAVLTSEILSYALLDPCALHGLLDFN